MKKLTSVWLVVFCIGCSSPSGTGESDAEGGAGGSGGEEGEDNEPHQGPLVPILSFEGFDAPAWSHDGTYLVARHVASGSLRRLNIETGDTEPFLPEGAIGVWSPVENVMAFVRVADDGLEMVLLDAENNRETVLPGIEDPCGFSWSPDGRKLATTRRAELPPRTEDDYPYDVEQHSELVLYSSDGEELGDSAHLEGYAKCNPTWSSDGTLIYFTSRVEAYDEWPRNERNAWDLAQDEVTVLQATPEEIFSPWIAGPDGMHVGWGVGRETSYVNICYGAGTDEPECLEAVDEGSGAMANIHPTSGAILVTARGYDEQVRLVDSTDGAEAYLWKREDPDPMYRGGYSDPAWSPVNHSFAVVHIRGETRHVEVIDAEPFFDQLE